MKTKYQRRSKGVSCRVASFALHRVEPSKVPLARRGVNKDLMLEFRERERESYKEVKGFSRLHLKECSGGVAEERGMGVSVRMAAAT